MLLDEDPAALIQECTSNFNIAPDRACLKRITDSLSALSSSRALRLKASRDHLRKLSRQLSTLSQQHDLAVSSLNPTDHASSILALDAQKFKVAKEASDAEVEGERLEMEVGGLEGVLRELEAEGEKGGVENAGREDRGVQDVLKLKLYRSLGIDVETDGTGQFKKAIIRNIEQGKVDVVNIDPRVSRNLYTDRFWQAL